LVENVRLRNPLLTNEERIQQTNYGEMIQNLGYNQSSTTSVIYDENPDDSDEKMFQFKNVRFILHSNENENLNQSSSNTFLPSEQEAIDFLFPNGIQPEEALHATILCGTNALVDYWNNLISSKRNVEEITLLSSDEFDEVDDLHGHLQRVLTDTVLDEEGSSRFLHIL
jgi:hypothetical protein